MKPNGFEPDELIIHQNTTIQFINQDIIDRWPASNVHPTHEIYPEFDPQKPIKPSAFWNFKATKIGEWKYHDHLLPHKRGTLIVVRDKEDVNSTSAASFLGREPTNSTTLFQKVTNFFKQILLPFLEGLRKVLHLPASPSTASESLKTPEAFKQLSFIEQQYELDRMARGQGSESTWNYFVTTFTSEAGTTDNIHDLAHFIGTLIYQQMGSRGLSVCTPQFAFGCFHGFLDSAFSQSLDKLSEAEKGCSAYGTRITGPVASCIHGIGHGIASFYQTTKLTEALSACERLGKGAQPYCYDGVFMEFERNAPSDFFKHDNPLYPCDSLPNKYRFSCGRNLPSLMLHRFKFSFTQVIKICQESKDIQLKTACMDALGYTAVAAASGEFQKIRAMCDLIISEPDRARCVSAAAGELVFQEVPGWQTNAFQLCQTLPLVYSSTCEAQVKHLIAEYKRDASFQLEPFNPKAHRPAF